MKCRLVDILRIFEIVFEMKMRMFVVPPTLGKDKPIGGPIGACRQRDHSSEPKRRKALQRIRTGIFRAIVKIRVAKVYGSFHGNRGIRTKRKRFIGKGKPDSKGKSDFQETERHALTIEILMDVHSTKSSNSK